MKSNILDPENDTRNAGKLMNTREKIFGRVEIITLNTHTLANLKHFDRLNKCLALQDLCLGTIFIKLNV